MAESLEKLREMEIEVLSLRLANLKREIEMDHREVDLTQSNAALATNRLRLAELEAALEQARR